MIEVMIAIVLTALAMLGVFSMYASETKAAAFSRHATEASVLAEDKIEKLRTGAAIAIPSTVEAGLNERGVTTPLPGIYTRTYQQVLSTASYADITVTVGWSDDGVPHSVLIHARRNQ